MNTKVKLVVCPICDTPFTESICPICGYDPNDSLGIDDSDDDDDLLSNGFENIDDYTDIL